MLLLAQSPPIHGAPPFLLAPSSMSTRFSLTTVPPRHLRKHYPSKPAKSPRRRPEPSDEINLKSLTARVVRLTRRRQLAQIFEDIKIAKQQHGKLNIIVMNAVMQACVHCHDIDSALRVFDEMSKPEGCGVDDVTYGTLLKGLGDAQMIDEAFQVLESVEKGTAVGSPQLSAQMICGLLNALTESGDLRRANGLLARYGHVLQEGGSPSILTFNLLMKGYITAGCPQAAIGVHDEILKHGLKPDRLSYNTLIFACIKNENLEKAMLLYEQMKDKAQNHRQFDVYPDLVTYTTLIQGLGRAKDITSVEKIFTEMKSRGKMFIDRVAYTAVVDALLNCESIKVSIMVETREARIDKIEAEITEFRSEMKASLSELRSDMAELRKETVALVARWQAHQPAATAAAPSCRFAVAEIKNNLAALVLFLTPQHANRATPSVPGDLQSPLRASSNIVASSTPPTLPVLAATNISNAVPLEDSPPARVELPLFDGGGHPPQTLHQFLPGNIRAHDLLDDVRNRDKILPLQFTVETLVSVAAYFQRLPHSTGVLPAFLMSFVEAAVGSRSVVGHVPIVLDSRSFKNVPKQVLQGRDVLRDVVVGEELVQSVGFVIAVVLSQFADLSLAVKAVLRTAAIDRQYLFPFYPLVI